MENKAAKQAVEAVTSDVLKYTQPGIRKYAFLDQRLLLHSLQNAR